jgi:hypothetical protein
MRDLFGLKKEPPALPDPAMLGIYLSELIEHYGEVRLARGYYGWTRLYVMNAVINPPMLLAEGLPLEDVVRLAYRKMKLERMKKSQQEIAGLLGGEKG